MKLLRKSVAELEKKETLNSQNKFSDAETLILQLQ